MRYSATFQGTNKSTRKIKKNKRFIKDNIKLSNEIMRLSKITTEIAKKDYPQRMIEDLMLYKIRQLKSMEKIVSIL